MFISIFPIITTIIIKLYNTCNNDLSVSLLIMINNVANYLRW